MSWCLGLRRDSIYKHSCPCTCGIDLDCGLCLDNEKAGRGVWSWLLRAFPSGW